jgi:hypothetical protein
MRLSEPSPLLCPFLVFMCSASPAQRYTCYKLRSFETAAVKVLFAQLPPNADDKMRAQAIAKLPTTWPAKGRVLFVEINGQKSRAYGPKHFVSHHALEERLVY